MNGSINPAVLVRGTDRLRLAYCAGLVNISGRHVTSAGISSYLIMRGDAAIIKPADATRLNTILNMSPTLVHRDSALIDTMKAVVNHAKSFKLDYGVKLSIYATHT